MMPWKFVCDFWFHEVLQTTMVRQFTKGFTSVICLTIVVCKTS